MYLIVRSEQIIESHFCFAGVDLNRAIEI
jgi:hypothetical protein